MNNDKIWYSISRKISGEATRKDILVVNNWLDSNSRNRKIYESLIEMWNTEKLTTENRQSLFDSIKRRIVVYENQTKRRFYSTALFKAAAIIVLILATNITVMMLSRSTKPETIAWQEVTVPRGNRMKITLPDSTTVWLNNESKIRYASNFNAANREVELSGEAYFHVRHNSEKPFVVTVGKKRIKVLGTRFSVNAYPEDRFIETALISGSVVFETDQKVGGKTEFKLEPGQALFYDTKSNKIRKEEIQTAFYNYWENGIYAFKDEKFEDLAVKIKRIFNVELLFEDEFLKTKTYTGTIHVNDNVFIFMEAIRRTSFEPIEYKFENNIIHVKLKNNKK